MKFFIKTKTETVDIRVAKAVDKHPHASFLGNTVYLKGNPIACYTKISTGVEIFILNKPWYITESFVKYHLRKLFS
jgi:hypothetical protein